MKKILTFLFILGAFATAQAQKIYKGLPEDLEKAELIIVRYETKDLIPQEAQSYEHIYAAGTDLQKACSKANLEVEGAAKYAYPFTYHILSEAQLKNLKQGKKYYIFEPAKVFGNGGPWGSVPLYLRNSETGEFYEVGFVPKKDTSSAEEIMEHFLKPVHKRYPVHKLDDFDGD